MLQTNKCECLSPSRLFNITQIFETMVRVEVCLLSFCWHHELFLNETIPNIIFPNRDWHNNPNFLGLFLGLFTKLGEGERD